MEIKPEEVNVIKTVGTLNGDDVKIVSTDGGFHVAIGKKNKNSRKSEALAAGSHIALVTHQVEKAFGQDFQPAMLKSEHEQLEKVEENTKLLPIQHRDFGLELYTLNKGENYDLILYKHGVTLGKYETEVIGDKLLIKSYEFKTKTPNSDIARAFAQMIENVMSKNGLKSIENKYL